MDAPRAYSTLPRNILPHSSSGYQIWTANPLVIKLPQTKGIKLMTHAQGLQRHFDDNSGKMKIAGKQHFSLPTVATSLYRLSV